MAEETDGRDNDVASDTQEPTGRVVQLPRDWFGPREELVPVGPRAHIASDAAMEASDDCDDVTATTARSGRKLEAVWDQAEDAGPRPPLAVDFWGGVTAVEDLVPFPSPAAYPPAREEARPNRGRGVGVRARVGRRPRVGSGRSVAVVGAVFVCALIGVRALAALLNPGRAGAGGQKLAHVHKNAPVTREHGSLDARDEPRAFGVRVVPGPARGHSSSRHRARGTRVPHSHSTASHSTPQVTSGQPVSYSAAGSGRPATSSPATTNSSAASGSDGGAGGGGQSGGGRSSGGGSAGGGTSRAGPTGPGAAFGPGTLGK